MYLRKLKLLFQSFRLNDELIALKIDLVNKSSELEKIQKKIGEPEGQIQVLSAANQKILKIRQTHKILMEAEKQLNKLKKVEINLQPG